MENDWEQVETTTHQDHVIAHVIGATLLGYLVLDDAIHLVLDIGFIWKIYIDGEMGLLPHPVATAELEVDADQLGAIKADVDMIMRDGMHPDSLTALSSIDDATPITAVELFSRDTERKVVIEQEVGTIVVELFATEPYIRLDKS